VTNTSSGAQVVRFGDYGLDLRSGELLHNGSRLLLAEQPFRILALMVRQPGTLVTRDDLRRELWTEDTFVDFEHSLNAAVKRLREALGDSAVTPRFIETLPRRGYRFIGDVDREHSASSPRETATVPLASPSIPEPGTGAKPRRDRLSIWWIVSASAAVLLIVAGLLASVRFSSSRVDGAPDLIRLTSTSGLNTDPHFRPTGSSSHMRLIAEARAASTSGFSQSAAAIRCGSRAMPPMTRNPRSLQTAPRSFFRGAAQGSMSSERSAASHAWS